MALPGRRFWSALVGIAVAACVAVTAISFYAARALTHHRSSRPAVTPADSGLTYQVVPLKARDGTLLEGWWIIPKDGARRPDLATVVLVHAADGERPGALTGKAGMLRQAVWLSRAGFIVLAFDFRSYGGSEGVRTTGGEEEQQDLEAALRLVRERAIGAPVAVLGEGMGAMVGLLVLPQDPSLRALIADSPNATRLQSLRFSGSFWSRWPIADAAAKWAGLKSDKSFFEVLRRASVKPLMLVRDAKLNSFHQVELNRALGPGNSSWTYSVPTVDHLRAFEASGGEYQTRASEFLESVVTRADSVRTQRSKAD